MGTEFLLENADTGADQEKADMAGEIASGYRVPMFR